MQGKVSRKAEGQQVMINVSMTNEKTMLKISGILASRRGTKEEPTHLKARGKVREMLNRWK